MISMTNEKAKKVTKKERFAQLLELEAVKANADLVAFINHEIELLENKNKSKSGEKKPTERQRENEQLKKENARLRDKNKKIERRIIQQQLKINELYKKYVVPKSRKNR